MPARSLERHPVPLQPRIRGPRQPQPTPSGSLLQQIFVDRAGHCAFTPAETITAVQVLAGRLDSGRWNLSALAPASLNAQAAALGSQYNIFESGSNVVPTPPAFLGYRPAPY